MRAEASEVIYAGCPECGAPCAKRRIRAEWGAGNGVRTDAVSCMRCGKKWLRVSLMDCGGGSAYTRCFLGWRRRKNF